MSRLNLVLLIALVGGCANATQSIPIPEAGKNAVAIVNGVPITTTDLELATRKSQHGAESQQADRKVVIENLVNAELVRQAAIKNGLDKLPENQEKIGKLFAQFMAAQRTELADAYFTHEVAAKTKITDEEARAHFDRHLEQLRNEYHILQILIKKDEAGIEAIQREIEGGISFEQAIAKRAGELPASSPRPWDLGFLRWSQLPSEWHAEIERLKPGEVSGIIKGAGQRFWILKLVEKRVNPALTFEAEKPIVVELLQRGKFEQVRREALESLKKGAKISYPVGGHP